MAYFEGVLLIEPDARQVQAMGRRGAGASGPVPVSFFMPIGVREELSLVLIPGGGLSSWSYTTTPDGREGWAQIFASAGYPVYLMNPPSGTRIQAGRWNKESVWPLWGIGPEYGSPYEASKFPHKFIDVLQDSFLIARSGGGAGHLLALLDEIGPAAIIAHSAGGGAMFSAARVGHPNFRGAFAVETTRCPQDEMELQRTFVEGKRWFFSIWGDNLDRGAPSMRARFESCLEAAQQVSKLGGLAETVFLPEDQDVHGNTHLMMQDTNNQEIAVLMMARIGSATTALSIEN